MPWEPVFYVAATALPLIGGFLLYLRKQGGLDAVRTKTLDELNTFLRSPDGRWNVVLKSDLPQEVAQVLSRTSSGFVRSETVLELKRRLDELAAGTSSGSRSGGYSTLFNQFITTMNSATDSIHARINALTKEQGDAVSGIRSDIRLLQEGLTTMARTIDAIEGEATKLISMTDKGDVYITSLRQFKEEAEGRLRDLDRRCTVTETMCQQRHRG